MFDIKVKMYDDNYHNFRFIICYLNEINLSIFRLFLLNRIIWNGTSMFSFFNNNIYPHKPFWSKLYCWYIQNDYAVCITSYSTTVIDEIKEIPRTLFSKTLQTSSVNSLFRNTFLSRIGHESITSERKKFSKHFKFHVLVPV